MHIFQFSCGLERVKKDGYVRKRREKGEKKEYPEWLFLDKNFKVVIEISANWASDFSEGIARIYYDDYIAFVDKNNHEITRIENKNIDWIDDFQEELARAQFLDGTMGYYDKNGKLVYQTDKV